jgi:glycerol uptake facilitator-like aquaporin
MAVVGSGIMGDRLAGGNVAIALLANTIATGASLITLILTFGPVSGAHFNPAVTQLAGALVATFLLRWLVPSLPSREPAVVVLRAQGKEVARGN